jgi:hypothetical protein
MNARASRDNHGPAPAASPAGGHDSERLFHKGQGHRGPEHVDGLCAKGRCRVRAKQSLWNCFPGAPPRGGTLNHTSPRITRARARRDRPQLATRWMVLPMEYPQSLSVPPSIILALPAVRDNATEYFRIIPLFCLKPRSSYCSPHKKNLRVREKNRRHRQKCCGRTPAAFVIGADRLGMRTRFNPADPPPSRSPCFFVLVRARLGG